MTRRVCSSSAAIRDLVEYAIYLGEQSPQAEERFLDAVEQSFARLTEMPEIGGAYETQTPLLAGLRTWGVKGFEKYLIFYRPSADRIDIIRTLQGARDIAAVLGDD